MTDKKDVPNPTERDHEGGSGAREAWQKPAITSYLPATAAEGISYNPLDGLTNLTP